MELKTTVDIGQLIIAGVLSLIGWFVKKELISINRRLDNHDDKIFKLMKNVSELIGAFNARKFERLSND